MHKVADYIHVVNPLCEEPGDFPWKGFVGGGLVGVVGSRKDGEQELWAGEGETGEDVEVVCFYDAIELGVDFVGAGRFVSAVGVEEPGEDRGKEFGG